MSDFYRTEQILTNDNINMIVSESTDVFSGIVKKNAITQTQFRITIEELLLRFRDFYGTEMPCRVVFAKHFGKYSIELSQEGERKEWLPCDEDIKISYDILARLGVVERYVYSHIGKGRNKIIWDSLVKPKKRSMLFSIVSAVTLAVIAGIIINICSPDIKNIIVNELISPVFSKMTSVLSALATPLVFFAVIGGIVGIGDVKAFGKIGSGLLLNMLKRYIVAALFLGVGGSIAYGIAKVSAETSGQGSAVGKVVQLVLDIVPDNMFVPFARDNDLQVIVVAIFIGITMLILGSKVARLNELVQDGSELINKMMMICCKMLPVVVFFGTVNLIVTSNAKQFISIGKMFVVFLSINAVFLLYMIIRAVIVTKTSVKTIFPKQLATLLINLTTSSQVAALPENMKCCKEKFGIDNKFVDFGLPLGIVVYMPSGAIFLGVTAWGLSVISGVPVDLSGIIRIMLICVILAIAAPPIPGSAFVVLPVLFASCGIPNEVFPLGIIFGTIIGYLCPAFNGFNIQLELLTTAKKMKKIDETKMRSPYKE